jgi:hypothetical protein
MQPVFAVFLLNVSINMREGLVVVLHAPQVDFDINGATYLRLSLLMSSDIKFLYQLWDKSSFSACMCP